MATHRRTIWPIVTIAIAVFCALIALPDSWKTWAPGILRPGLHLGLDLAGGTQLDFRISEDEINARKQKLRDEAAELEKQGGGAPLQAKQVELQSVEEQHANIVEAIRIVLERRINSLGVSEATITPSYFGSEKHLLVECPGVIDVNKCIETVGKTIQLEFKEEYSGSNAEYEQKVRTKAEATYKSLTGTGNLQIAGQDLGNQLGMAYFESKTYFASELTPGVKEFWNRKPTDPVLKTEGTIKVATQDEQGTQQLKDVNGIYVGKVVEARKPVNHPVRDPAQALPLLKKKLVASNYEEKTGVNPASLPKELQIALTTMQTGARQVVQMPDDQAVLVYLRGRVEGAEEMTASHILIQYKGAQRADTTVTRNKEQAFAKIKEIKDRLAKGESFNAIARSESDGPSKGEAGKLPSFKRGVMTPQFETAAFALKQGHISDIVETQFGYHIIRSDKAVAKIGSTVTFHRLTLKGKDAFKQLTDASKEIDDGKVTITEDQITLQALFFSLEPTGWKDTPLNGQRFLAASVTTDQVGNIPVVRIQFDEEGAKLFQDMTKRNINKRIAIFVGGELVSAPTVNAEIAGGTAVITGSRNFEEARKLAQDLNTGAIPAPIYLSGQSTIEATLGTSALQQSVNAGLVGLLVLGFFMILIYRMLGLMADIALAFYVILLVAAMKLPLFLLSSQYVVLTLAGIAGIILSMGMAVDANVLAFERIKEEVAKGKLLKTAVETGFQRAWPSVRDGNVSTLITCAILFVIGTSIIRGFAITLAIGIVLSMFTAIVVTRFLVRKLIASPMGQRLELFGVKDQGQTQQQTLEVKWPPSNN